MSGTVQVNPNQQAQSQPSTIKNPPPQKGSKNKGLIVFFVILGCAVLITIVVFVLLFLLKHCGGGGGGGDGKYCVTITQPDPAESQGYVIYAKTASSEKFYTDKFYCNRGDEIDVIVSDHGINCVRPRDEAPDIELKTPGNDYDYQYYIGVKYGPNQFEEHILTWDSTYEYYSTYWVMHWENDIVISVGVKRDVEQYFYVKRANDTEIWIINDETISPIKEGVPIQLIKWTNQFPVVTETETIERDKFNEKVYVGNKIHNIEDRFFTRCTGFNSEIEFRYETTPQGEEICNLTQIGANFLIGCTNFNKPFNFPSSLESIDGDFLFECTNYNQPINTKNVKYLSIGIEKGFLNRCSSFNSELKIPNVIVIPSFFMNCCSSFNQPLEITSKVISIEDAFMFGCDNMTSTLTINCSPDAFVGKSHLRDCATSNENAECWKYGIRIAGDSKKEWMTSCPNGTVELQGETIYRHLIEVY